MLEHLVQAGLVSAAHVRDAESLADDGGDSVFDALLRAGAITEVDLARGVASFFRFPLVNLKRIRVAKSALKEISGEFCRRHQLLPFGVDSSSGELLVAVADPAQIVATDALRFRNNQHVKAYVAPRSQLREAIEYYYFGPGSTGERPPRRSSTIRKRASDTPLSAELPIQTGEEAPAMPVHGSTPQRDDDAPPPPNAGVYDSDLGLRNTPNAMSRRRLRPSGHQKVPALGLARAVTNSTLGPLNRHQLAPIRTLPTDSGVTHSDLEQRILQLEAALDEEMGISQALAEILVENGLISAEQLKSHLRRRRDPDIGE